MTDTTRNARKPRKPRDPRTRQTALAPGEEYVPPESGRVPRADYRLYMRSAAWLSRRWRWWDEAGRPTSCAACGGHWSMNAGHLHHRTYDRLGHELHGDLLNLCDTCHDLVHVRCRRWRDLARVTDEVVDEIVSRRSH